MDDRQHTCEVAQIGSVTVSNAQPFVLIAGPCQLESSAHALECADALTEITRRLKIPFIFKTSYDKANRTSHLSRRGVGLHHALEVFSEIRKRYAIPVTTDIHLPEQCAPVAEVVDLLQIPAFLCRQTDLLIHAAQTKRAINIKKGQFLAPWDMRYVVDKLRAAGNSNLLVTDRGTCFGYNTLVSDMRCLPIMAEACRCPVVFDATHSVQQPGGNNGQSGGQRRFVAPLARAAVAVGVAALFIETHPDPESAPSDGDCMIPLNQLEPLLIRLKALDQLVKSA